MAADHAAIEAHGGVKVWYRQSDMIDVRKSGQSFVHRASPAIPRRPCF
jgi:hypothetical protein